MSFWGTVLAVWSRCLFSLCVDKAGLRALRRWDVAVFVLCIGLHVAVHVFRTGSASRNWPICSAATPMTFWAARRSWHT